MIVRSSVVKPDEHRRSQTALSEWPPGETEHDTVMELAQTARSYYTSSIRVATEKDTDFFDALCEFNFGLLTRGADAVFARSLMSFMHIWVSLSFLFRV